MDAKRAELHIERSKYITAVVLYGTIGMFLRFVHLPSELVALCRGAIGSLFIFFYRKARGRTPDRAAIRRNAKWLLLSGVCLGLNWTFLFAAYTTTTVAIASLCNYMAPVIVLIAAPALLHERMDRRKLPCVALALVGIVLVSGVTGGGANAKGVFLGLAAALCFAAIVLCNRNLRGISAEDRSIVQLALSALTILPYFLIRNRGAAILPDARSIAIVLMLGAVHTGVAYCLYFSGMATLPVQTVAILGYLEPVVSVLCSALFLHERMTGAGWIGTALILAAAIASELIPDRSSSGR